MSTPKQVAMKRVELLDGGGRTPRIFDRDEVDHQSKGKATIARDDINWTLVYFRAPVIMLLDAKTTHLFGVMFIMYTLSFVLFAPFYYYFSDRCGLEIKSFQDAFYLSLETIITIGYGVPDVYYNECPEGIPLLMIQSVTGRILDALLMGVCIIRMVRSSRRTCSTLFTDKAFLNFKQGKLYMSFQVADMRREKAIEAHIRVYVIRHLQHPVRRIHYQTVPLRLLHPDDDLSAMVFLAIPNTIVHEVDIWSALFPPQFQQKNTSKNGNSFNSVTYPGSLQRASDRETGGNTGYSCRACGDSYETLQQVRVREYARRAVQLLTCFLSLSTP
jgi:hypothetical protein